jgi:hypothetical protein
MQYKLKQNQLLLDHHLKMFVLIDQFPSVTFPAQVEQAPARHE